MAGPYKNLYCYTAAITLLFEISSGKTYFGEFKPAWVQFPLILL